ncbi:MAG: hypothetical protein ACREP9_10855 [Candidatus Dormibacteraceae bacterium]
MISAALVNSGSRFNSSANDTSYHRAQSWIDQSPANPGVLIAMSPQPDVQAAPGVA